MRALVLLADCVSKRRTSNAKRPRDAERFADGLIEHWGVSRNDVVLLSLDGRKENLSSRENVLARLKEFESAGDFDAFIFGYWGRDFARAGNDFYFDFPSANDANSEREALSFGTLVERAGALPVSKVFLFWDCYDESGSGVRFETTREAIERLESVAREIGERLAKRQKNPVVVVFNANEQGQNARYDDEFGGGLFTGRFLEALSQRVSRGVYSLDAVASLTSRFAFERAKELGLVFRSDGRERSEQTPFFFQFGEGTISFDSKSTDGESTTSRVSLSIGNEPVKSVSTVEVRKLIVAALSAFEREDYSKAKELAESALQRDSDSKSAKRVLNEVAKKLSQVDSVRALIREGWTLYEMDRAEDALSKADEALKLDPASAGAKKLRDLSKKRLDEGLLLANPASPDESRVQNERRSSESDNLVLIEPERYRALRDEPSAGTRKTIAVNGVDFPFRFCPDGSFLMGASENKKVYDNELPQRAVFLSGFWILEVPVTQAMWRAVTSRDAPCSFRGERLPVERVTWRECRDFAEALNELNAAPRGLRFSLPSEAQWEYACRAGWKTEYFWGDSLNGTEANCDGKFPFGSTSKGPFVGKTTEVGSYKSNAWGVFDASGNVWEWCLDWYGEYSKDDVRDPFGPSSGTRRVARGGSWSSRAVACRSGYRNCFAPESRRDNLGFRLALSSAVNREEIGERSKERSSELTTDSSDGPRSVYALTDEPSAIERVAPSKEDAFRARELASKAFEAFEAGNFEEAKRLAETAIFFAPDIGAAKFVLSEAERQLLKR